MKESSDKLSRLANLASQEFADAADYIWKSPQLRDHETAVELNKLRAYFPNDLRSARLRWKYESNKLTRVFPYMISVGNLFSVISLFERYLLLLIGELEKRTGTRLNSVQGQSVTRLFNYFRVLGLDLKKIELFHQVQAAVKIRNCFAHASGLLAWSREEKELKRIQKSGTYLSKIHRDMRRAQERHYDEVQISSTGLGDRLYVTNQYAFVVTSYLRDYFIDLCQLAKSCKLDNRSKG